MQNFKELKLAPQLEKALVAMNFDVPTPIQAESIPIVMSGKDLIACAQTGTGKTAAFGIPTLNSIYSKKETVALVLVPTRELAVQVTQVFRQLAFHMPHVRVVDLIGGISMQPQLRAIAKGYRVLVATPGRLLDHLERGSVKLQKMDTLILDEADRMLDMGFAPQLRQIFKYLPKTHQTLLFSATFPPNIQELTKTLLKDPAKVQVGAVSKPIEKIEQSTRSVNGEAKNAAVMEEIKAREGSILIFVRTQKRTDRLARFLIAQHIPVGLIHGGRSQNQRNRAIDEFKNGDTRILVATDIAARGIDIEHVAHVINYDLPQVPEDYVHRIGRTARAGREGKAISLISHEERPLWRDIEKLLQGKGATGGAMDANGGTHPTQPKKAASEKPRNRFGKPGPGNGRPGSLKSREGKHTSGARSESRGNARGHGQNAHTARPAAVIRPLSAPGASGNTQDSSAKAQNASAHKTQNATASKADATRPTKPAVRALVAHAGAVSTPSAGARPSASQPKRSNHPAAGKTQIKFKDRSRK